MSSFPSNVDRSIHTRDPALVGNELTHGLSHDLRSPLMAISGFAQVLGYYHRQELGPDAQRCVDNIVAASARLEQMVDSLADCGRLGQAVLDLQELELQPLLRALVLAPGVRAAAPRLVLAPDLPRVQGDALVLRQVFSALLEYVRAADESGARLCLFGRGAQGLAQILICDERSLRGTEAPWFASQSGPAPGPLVSLGLALARRGAELHGGYARIESSRRTGCVAQVDLPGLRVG